MNYIEKKVISFLDKQEWKSVIKSNKKEAKKIEIEEVPEVNIDFEEEESHGEDYFNFDDSIPD